MPGVGMGRHRAPAHQGTLSLRQELVAEHALTLVGIGTLFALLYGINFTNTQRSVSFLFYFCIWVPIETVIPKKLKVFNTYSDLNFYVIGKKFCLTSGGVLGRGDSRDTVRSGKLSNAELNKAKVRMA
jgi:hypothetical protein